MEREEQNKREKKKKERKREVRKRKRRNAKRNETKRREQLTATSYRSLRSPQMHLGDRPSFLFCIFSLKRIFPVSLAFVISSFSPSLPFPVLIRSSPIRTFSYLLTLLCLCFQTIIVVVVAVAPISRISMSTTHPATEKGRPALTSFACRLSLAQPFIPFALQNSKIKYSEIKAENPICSVFA